jgi:hypothetical protein
VNGRNKVILSDRSCEHGISAQSSLSYSLGPHNMRGLKQCKNAGQTKNLHAYIKESCIDEGKGY